MEISVTPEAAAFVRKRGGHLRLFASKINGCCGVGAGLVPMFEIGVPRKRSEQHQAQTVDGVTVHVDKGLAAEQGHLRIGMTGLLWKTLAISSNDEP
ncbi:MAG: CC/Se motif family (seleno)protein [Mycobacterium leprae]